MCDLDFDWYEALFDSLKEPDGAYTILGVENPEIGFSGFWSQGDGAHFTGTWQYRQDAVKRIKESYPKDEVLHKIAEDLEAAQSHPSIGLQILTGEITGDESYLVANLRHNGHHYPHEYAVQVDVDTLAECGVDEKVEDLITTALRDLMRWTYRALEEEYVYLCTEYEADEESEELAA